MIGNPFEMVVAIILIVTIGRVISGKRHGGWRRNPNGLMGMQDDSVEMQRLPDPETEALRGEISMLKERIQVLERIATDNSSANDVSRQIEALRDKQI